MPSQIILPNFFDQLTENKTVSIFCRLTWLWPTHASNCMIILPNFWWVIDKSRIVIWPFTHFKS